MIIHDITCELSDRGAPDNFDYADRRKFFGAVRLALTQTIVMASCRQSGVFKPVLARGGGRRESDFNPSDAVAAVFDPKARVVVFSGGSPAQQGGGGARFFDFES